MATDVTISDNSNSEYILLFHNSFTIFDHVTMVTNAGKFLLKYCKNYIVLLFYVKCF